MKRTLLLAIIVVTLVAVPGWGAALGTAAGSVIPSQVQQIITVDYRQLAASPTALALKAKVLPDNLKDLETALRGVGVDPDKDVDSLSFASFRTEDKGVRIIGIAQGQFTRAKIIKGMRAKKIKPSKYHTSFLYPMGSAMQVTFLDEAPCCSARKPRSRPRSMRAMATPRAWSPTAACPTWCARPTPARCGACSTPPAPRT